MSTSLDVEKLSLEDSDVSFSELATRCRDESFVFRRSRGAASMEFLIIAAVWIA
jgi:hypothetical protein